MIEKLRYELMQNIDSKYKEFHQSLLSGEFNVLGIRVPKMREISKRIALEIKDDEIESFIKSDSLYYEEKMIKGMVIGYLKKDKSFILKLLKGFVKKIDNWGICDSFCATLKIMKKENDYFYPFLEECLSSNDEFVIRFAIVSLLNHYVNDRYIDRIIEIIKRNYPDYYYINMAIAWLICDCYIKYPNKTKVLFDGSLNKFINNKAISKIHDSFRVKKEEKEELKKYRIH